MKAIIIVERDGWTWRIEPQEGCDAGIDIVSLDTEDKPYHRECIGTVDDAEALGKAILAFVEFARKGKI